MKTKNNINNLIICLLALVLLLPVRLIAQLNPFEVEKFEFISYDDNGLILNDHQQAELFFSKLDRLILQGKGKINILHIGDSHIQADYVSGHLRKRFQEMAWGLNGGRGFVFPVKMAQSNNPWNFSVSYTGNWESCKNVEKEQICPLGLAGYLVATTDQKAGIRINFKEDNSLTYSYNTLRVFHNMDTATWQITPENSSLTYTLQHRPDSGFSEFRFDSPLDSMEILISKQGVSGEFVFRGFQFMNDDPGIVYHSVGVNGAKTESWLRCPLLEKEISCIAPDLIIISLGTNDAYTSKFDAEVFENNCRQLLTRLQRVAPDAAVLWVTPGDNYRYRKYLNYSTEKASDVILKLGGEKQFMVWDFYDIMGELNAIMSWYRAGLTAHDKLHFNKKGYTLQANLMFNAFLRAYNQHIENKTKNWMDGN
ncbi:MAG: GDSL-type esterase/lipase family protein [Bacteroidales bacterium]